MGFAKVCYRCPDRHYLCHATCKRHKDAKAEHDAEQAVIKKERAKLNDVEGLFAETTIKAIKRRRDR